MSRLLQSCTNSVSVDRHAPKKQILLPITSPPWGRFLQGRIFEVHAANARLNGPHLRPWSEWTANNDKKLNVNKPCLTSRKTAFRLPKRHLAGTCTVHIIDIYKKPRCPTSSTTHVKIRSGS